jgi:hypothetical protein
MTAGVDLLLPQALVFKGQRSETATRALVDETEAIDAFGCAVMAVMIATRRGTTR